MYGRTLGSLQNDVCRYSARAQDLLVLEAMSDGPRYSVPKFLPVTLSRQLSCSPSQVGMYICTTHHLHTKTDRHSDISTDVDLNLSTKRHL